MTENTETLKFTIDGEELTAFKGETVLQAALRNDVFIPHYCWHPGLGVDGNCRMCLVYTKPGPPKPNIACNTMVSEGMEVENTSARVKKDREGVLSFLLANHPLDCPICDQAGECDLQQYSFDYGRETSDFVDIKTQAPRKDFGPLIRFNGNRCIKCTRCVRFTHDVTGTGELSVVNRSDSASIDVFPGIPLDNPLSACVADLCPVGALLETDSIHTTRTWLLRGTKSVCGSCATGCNINVESYNDEVKRLTPRENQAVNKWWMCDAGRLSRHEAESETRVLRAEVGGNPATPQEALRAAIDIYQAAGKANIAGLVTGYATNEELYLLRQLVGKGPIGVAHRPGGQTFTTKDGFSISEDKNPNRIGVEKILGTVSGLDQVLAALRGSAQVLIVLDAIPGTTAWPEELEVFLEDDDRTANIITIALDTSAASHAADVTLPGLHWTEKDGTFINGRGRLQRVRAAVPAPSEGGRTDLELLQELARAAGIIPRVISAGGVFRRLAAAHPAEFGDMTYALLGEVGLPLPKAEDTTPPDECKTYYEAGPVSRGPSRALDEQTRIPVHRESTVGYGTNRGNM